MWFHPELLKTDTFEEIVEVNEPHDATDLREAIEEMFLQQPDHVVRIEMTMKEIKEEFFKPTSSTRWIHEILKDYLLVDLKRNPATGAALFSRGSYKKYCFDSFRGDFVEQEVKWRGRPYVFLRSQFIKDGSVEMEAPQGESVRDEATEEQRNLWDENAAR